MLYQNEPGQSHDHEQSNHRILNLMIGILEETSVYVDEIDQNLQQERMTQDMARRQIHAVLAKIDELKQRAKSYGALQEGRAQVPQLEQLNNIFNRLDIQMMAYQDIL